MSATLPASTSLQDTISSLGHAMVQLGGLRLETKLAGISENEGRGARLSKAATRLAKAEHLLKLALSDINKVV